MPATLTIALSAELLEALTTTKSITIHLANGGPAPEKTRRPAASNAPRSGSLPARITEWAETRAKPFGNAEIVKKFKVSRAHASMLLSTMFKRGLVKRVGRGVYQA